MKNTKRYLISGLLAGVILMLGVFIQNKLAYAASDLSINALVYGTGHESAHVVANENGGPRNFILAKGKTFSNYTLYGIGITQTGTSTFCVHARSGGRGANDPRVTVGPYAGTTTLTLSRNTLDICTQ